MVHYSVDWQGA